MPELTPREDQEERLEVLLIPKAAADLQRTRDRTKMSRTDITNRALSLYEFIDSELAEEGTELVLRRGGQDYLVKLL